MGGQVIYRWIAEARATPHRYARMRCSTRDQARRARDAMNSGRGERLRDLSVTFVVRRLEPPVWAPVTEQAWLEPDPPT
jgi:hypothetical protein